MEDRELFGELWQRESETTRKVFERIPEGSDYRPDPRSRTAQEIAWQMVCEERAILDGLREGRVAWNPEPMPASIADLLAAYDAWREEVPERLAALTPEQWAGEVDLAGHVAPAGRMAWSFLFDLVHHRGQLTTYLRPMGSTVPQIYGPSADEP